MAWKKVWVESRYTPAKQIFLDNAKELGFAFHVSDPLLVEEYLPLGMYEILIPKRGMEDIVLYRRALSCILVYSFDSVVRPASFLGRDHSSITHSLKVFNDACDVKRLRPDLPNKLIDALLPIIEKLNARYPEPNSKSNPSLEQSNIFAKNYFEYGVSRGYLSEGDAAHLELKRASLELPQKT